MVKTNNWEEKSLDNLGFLGRGKSRHRPRNAPFLYDGKYPFIQTADITNSIFHIIDYTQTYSEAGLAQSRMWNPGTLCIVNAGVNTGDTAILTFKACFPDSVIGFVADKEKCDVRFIKYFLDSIKTQIKQVTMGATQDNLSVSKLISFRVPTPHVNTQRKIAAILSAYDDLIENNQRRIKILEEMAQNLYREWFVKFRFPGHQNTRFVDSTMGRIPEGWEIKAFSELANYINGYAFKPNDWGKEGKPIIKIKELKAGIVAGTPRNQGEDIPEKYNVENGDVLFSWSADLNAYLWRGGSGLLNQHLFNVVPFDGITRAFCFHALKEAMPRFRTLSLGATMHHIKRSALNQVFSIVSTEELRNDFDVLVAPMHGQIITLTKHVQNLRRTRDLLLPRLISGEVDVSELDIAVPEEDRS